MRVRQRGSCGARRVRSSRRRSRAETGLAGADAATMVKVAVAEIAEKFDSEIKQYVTSCSGTSGPPLLVGFLADGDTNNSMMYAKMTRRACERNGVRFELREVDKFKMEEAVISANADPNVHGILVYYPIFGGSIDEYMRDVISYEKDVEGLNHRYRYAMYHNIRHVDEEATKKCVLPCTPLAVVKILESLGAYDKSKPVGQQLSGTTAIVYNRSEVVGRPLGAMLANDGALVYSVDVTGILVYTKGRVAGTIKVEDTSVTIADALAASTIVVSGVPSKSFSIDPAGVRSDALCVNFSQFSNFGPGIEERVKSYVPAIGKVTIAMLERNLTRLHANFHPVPSLPANFAKAARGGAGAVLRLEVTPAVAALAGAVFAFGVSAAVVLMARR